MSGGSNVLVRGNNPREQLDNGHAHVRGLQEIETSSREKQQIVGIKQCTHMLKVVKRIVPVQCSNIANIVIQLIIHIFIKHN